MPVIVKILVSLLVILLVMRFTKLLVPAIAAGTLVLGFWAGHSVSSFLSIAGDSFFALDNFMLIAVIFLVIWFSLQLSKTGIMTDLVGAVGSVFSKRAGLAVLPAVIGLLPMPGGALFSAPLVDDFDKDKEVDPLLKTKINFWFRHIWEYWWPLYPGVMAAIYYTGLSMAAFILPMMFMTFVSVGTGYLFFLRKVKKELKKGETKSEKKGMKTFFKPLIPIFVLISTYIIVSILFPVLQTWSKYLPMCIAIITAMLVQQILRPLVFKKWITILLSRKALMMALLIAVIRIYGEVVKADIPGGYGLIDQVRLEMASVGIPVFLLIILLPFISALSSGIAVAFVGASMPIVMQLIGADASFGLVLSTAILAYGSGYTGLLLSPVHVCLIVTNDHFKTSLVASIREMLLPASFVFAGVCLLSMLIRIIFV